MRSRGSKQFRLNSLRVAYAIQNDILPKDINGDIDKLSKNLYGKLLSKRKFGGAKRKLSDVDEAQDVNKVANDTINLIPFKDYGGSRCTVSNVKRGMVFWYDIDPSVNKYAQHKIFVKNKTYPDHIIYGLRPWVVISINESSDINSLVTVIPFTSSKGVNKNTQPFRVAVDLVDRQSIALCEQIRTVNISELTNFFTILDEQTMAKIEQGLNYFLGLTSNKPDYEDISLGGQEKDKRVDTDKILHEISLLVKTLIKYEVEAEVNKKLADLHILFKEKDLDSEEQIEGIGADNSLLGDKQNTTNSTVCQIQCQEKAVFNDTATLTKIGNKKELINNKLSPIDKFYKRYPNLKKQSDSLGQVKQKIKRRTWSEDIAKDFIMDLDTLNEEEIYNKWGLQNKRTFYNIKFYLKKKYPELWKGK